MKNKKKNNTEYLKKNNNGFLKKNNTAYLILIIYLLKKINKLLDHIEKYLQEIEL